MKKFSELEYQRPDMKKLKKDILSNLKVFESAETYEEAKQALLALEKINGAFETQYVIAEIRNTINMKDEFYDKEVEFFNEETPKLMPISEKINLTFLNSKFKDDFKKEFGSIFITKKEEELKTISKKIISDMVKEGSISQSYSKTVAECKTEFRGKDCNFYGLLKHMQSTDRVERKEAFEAWAKLYASVSGTLDKYYDKLIKLRVRMAEKLEFSSYTDLAYVRRQRFDYKQEQVANFRKQVKEIIVPACAKLYEEQRKQLGVDTLYYYDESLIYPEGNPMPIGDKDSMIAAAKQMYRELSKETGEFFDFMVENELFDLETKPNKHLGGYCTFLYDYKAPFIFSNFNGTSADVDVLTHEAGHAFEAYEASRVLELADLIHSTSEINEIHSMSMEHFTYPWMDKFFGEKADEYKAGHLKQALCTIPYLVSVDEFQHRVYEKPSMTAKERRAVWHEIEQTYLPWRNYDGNKFLEEGGFWMQKQHIFLYPFYYVDYALAQMGAFELFNRMNENKEQAWEDYLRLCRAGGSKGYFELLKVANLHNPFEDGTVKLIVDGVVKSIEVLNSKLS